VIGEIKSEMPDWELLFVGDKLNNMGRYKEGVMMGEHPFSL